jgi:hypothetical protein
MSISASAPQVDNIGRSLRRADTKADMPARAPAAVQGTALPAQAVSKGISDPLAALAETVLRSVAGSGSRRVRGLN